MLCAVRPVSQLGSVGELESGCRLRAKVNGPVANMCGQQGSTRRDDVATVAMAAAVRVMIGVVMVVAV